MSRSFRKTPKVKFNSRFGKKYSNKVIRQTFDVPNYSKFKRIFNSWDISDMPYSDFTNSLDDDVEYRRRLFKK